MNTSNEMVVRRFWLRWLIACTVSLAIGLAVFFALVLGIGSDQELSILLALAIVGGAVLGAVVGAGQWFVLRRRFEGSGQWIWVSALGGAVGGGTAVAVADRVGDMWGFEVGFLLGCAVLGAGLGLAQWFLLRSRLPHAGWWVLASSVGFALGFGLGRGLGGALYYASSDAIGEGLARLLATLIFLFLPLATFGLITGAALAWLSRSSATGKDNVSPTVT